MSFPPGYEHPQAGLPSYSAGPSGYPNAGPPPGYLNAGPPPGYLNAGPPPGYPNAGPPLEDPKAGAHATPGIGLFPKYVFNTPTRLVIRHVNHLRNNFDVYIQNGSEGPTSVTDEHNLDKIMSGTAPIIAWGSNRLWTDAKTGQPLFRIKQKSMRYSYNILAADGKGEPTRDMGLIDTHDVSTFGHLVDHFDLVVNGGAGMQQYAKLEAKSDSVTKSHLEVMCDGRRVMSFRRTDTLAYLLCGKRLTWEVDLEPGVDACLAAMIVGVSSDILLYGH
ncbi:hypothetical protein KEM56_002057 [Ascosphaera pollenicola]|nr:hypothetical protein KEM56_002057 [Ascosphaera pollenicola]